MSYDLLVQWFQVKQQLDALKEQERQLRDQVFNSYFPEAEYGTNKCDIPGDAELVADYPLNLSIDESSLEAALESVPKTKRDKIVRWKPNLAKAVYNTLSKKSREGFDECVIAKPGAPSLKIRTKQEEE